MRSKITLPLNTCALVIVGGNPEYAPGLTPAAATAFLLTGDRLSPRFSCATAMVLPGMSREDALAHVADLIPSGARVLLRAPRLPRGLVRQLRDGRSLPAPIFATLLKAERPDLDLLPLGVPEEALAKISSMFGLARADRRDELAERVRRSGDEAQALFLAHLFSTGRDRHWRQLAAAYQAWQVLQRARPISPFGPAEAF